MIIISYLLMWLDLGLFTDLAPEKNVHVCRNWFFFFSKWRLMTRNQKNLLVYQITIKPCYQSPMWNKNFVENIASYFFIYLHNGL